MAAGESLGPPGSAANMKAGVAGSTARREVWLGGMAVFLALGLLTEAKLWRLETRFGIAENVQIAEAQAWWSGRLDLPQRKWDTALYQGRVYSYFPPMFTILAACVVPFFDGVPHGLIVLLVAAVPACAYLLFYRLTASPLWGALLTIGYVGGTSLWPVIDKTLRGAPPYSVNHTIASLGILVLLIELLGRRRMWVATIGLALAALSRQLTIVYALPLLYGALSTDRPGRRSRVVAVLAGGAIIAVVYLGLNTLKFGHPFTTGYMLTHKGRNDVFARETRVHGLLSTYYVPRNLYYANVGLPKLHRVEIAGEPRWYLRPNEMGTGIWWTTPLLFWLLIDIRGIAGDRSRLALLIAAAAVFCMLLFWHATGAVQRGFNRYSMDYMAVLFALVVPRCVRGRRRWITAGMIVWSVVYFRLLLGMPHLRVW